MAAVMAVVVRAFSVGAAASVVDVVGGMGRRGPSVAVP
jgi:hypothetical protein